MAGKITEMTEDASPATTSLVETTKDPSGTPLTRKVSLANIFALLRSVANAFTANVTIDAGTAAADTDGTDLTISAMDGGAHTSNNPDGGDIVLTPGAAGSGGSGAAGVIQINGKLTGPASGDWTIEHTPTGTDLIFVSGNGIESCRVKSHGPFYLIANQEMGNSQITGTAVGLKGNISGVMKVTNGSTGGGVLEFGIVADVPAAQADCAGIGAEDVATVAELIGYDEAGNETQLTPHAADGPASLYDEIPGAEIVHRTINRYTGVVEFLNASRQAKMLDMLAAGQSIAGIPAIRHVETLAAYNARTGKSKAKLDWDTVQAAKQARYDAERADEIAKRQAAADEHAAAIERIDVEYAKRLAKWQKLPAKNRAEIARPVKPDAPQLREVAIREAKDIRKPKPAFIQ